MQLPGRRALRLGIALAALWPLVSSAFAQPSMGGRVSVVIQQPAGNTDVSTLGYLLTDIPLVIAFGAPEGVDKLEVWVDGKLQLTDSIPGEREGTRSYLWDVTLHGPGAHRIAAVAYSGTQSARAEVTVTYGPASAGADVPTVRFSSPVQGQVITGVTTLDVRAEGVTPKWVMFLLDERQVGTKIGVPLSMSFDTSGYADGAHALQAIVCTESGEKLDSEILHVVFRNSPVPGGREGTAAEATPGLPAGALVVIPPIDPEFRPTTPVGEAPMGGLVVPSPAPEFVVAEPTDVPTASGPLAPPADLTPLESEIAGGTGGAAPLGGAWKPLGRAGATGPAPEPTRADAGSIRPLEPDLAGPGRPASASWRSLSNAPRGDVSALPVLQPGLADEAPTTAPASGSSEVAAVPQPEGGAVARGASIPEPELAGPEGEQTHAVPVRSAVGGTSSPHPTTGPQTAGEREIAVRVGGSAGPLGAPGIVRGALLLVPLEALAEALGGRCALDAQGRTVAEFQSSRVAVRAGSDEGQHGEATVRLECRAEDREGVLYVPFSLLRDLWCLSVTTSSDGETAQVVFIPEPGVE